MTDTTAGSANAHLSGRRRRPVALRGFLSKALLGSAQIALIAAAFLGGSTVTPVVAANASANLDQCANDPAPSPNTDGCSASASDWVNGNLGPSKSVYVEGDSIPYRLTFGNLSTTGSHTVSIEWDTTQGGKHAIDYLTTFNRSVLDANPCLGVAGCNPTAGKQFDIPPDTQMTSHAETISNPGQAPGKLTIFGGLITGVSDYSGGGLLWPAGNNSRSITITFTATVPNAVLAWGGHIAQRFPSSDSGGWGLDNSAVAISGSPYHTRLLELDGSGGNQDRSLSADAVIFPGFIHVNKTTTGGDATFSYSASPTPLVNCSITTSGGTGGGPGAANCWFNTITNFQTYTVTETTLPLNWTFSTLACSVLPGTENGGTRTINGAIATINLAEGEGVTCTYANTLQSAAVTVTKTADAASVSAGSPIGFTVTVHNAGTGTATGVTLTDPLPGGSGTGVTWVKDAAVGNPAAFTLAGAPGSQTLTLAGQPITLAAGATLSVHVTAQTSASECSTYNNTATVASTNDGGNSAPASIVCQSAAVTVTKTADAASVSAGSPIGFTVTVHNAGTGTATGVTLTDPLPGGSGTGVTWVKDAAVGNPAAFTLAGAPGSQTLTLAGQPITLAAGATLSVHVTAQTSASECSTYNNTATVASTNDGGNSAPASIVCQSAAVTVTKTADAASVSAGSPIGFTVTVHNAGTGTATGVTLTDPLPGGSGTGVTWVKDAAVGNPAAFTLAGAPGSQTLTLAGQPITLAAGATLSVHVTAQTSASECSTYNNTATVASTNDGGNSAPASIVCQSAAVTVTKTADAASVSAGSPIGFTVTVHNAGTGTANGVTLTDPLPGGSGTGVTWVKDAAVGNPAAFTLAGAPGSQTLTLAGQPITLAAGATLSVHVTAQTSASECSTYNNTATVASTNDGGNSAPASIVCQSAAVTVTKTADAASVSAGDTIGYTVTISNTGLGDAAGVSLTDNLPGGNAATPVHWVIDNGIGQPAAFSLTGADGGQVLRLAGQPITLAAGQSRSVHLTAATTSTSCATYDNSAAVTSTNDGSPSAGPVTITVNCGALAITKTADAPSVSAGSPIGYVITVTNTGAGALTGVHVTDTLPTNPGLTWSIDAAGSSLGWSIAGGVLSFGPAPLLAGASVHVHITSPTTPASCGSVDNTAAVSSTNDGSASVGPVGITVLCATLGVTKTADAASVSAGDTIGYTVTISNTGLGDAAGVSLTDNLPGGNAATPVHWVIDNGIGQPAAFSLTGADGGQVLRLAGQPITLAAGQSRSVHLTAATTSTSCATYDNSAAVTSTNDGSPSAGPVTITVNCGALAITKTADAPSVSAGSPIGYVITVTNTGAGALTGVHVTDTLPTNPGLTWSIDAAGSSLGWSIAGGVLSFGPAPLLAGASVHVHITSPTTPASCGSVDNTAAVSSTNDGSASVGPVGITVLCATLGVTKTADAASVSAGDTIGYTVTISNTGLGDAAGVNLTDNLPGGNAATPVHWVIDNGIGQPAAFSLTGADGGQVLRLAGQPITLAAGQSRSVHLTAATTSTSCATYDNSAAVTSTNDGSPSAGPVTITVNCGALAITKTADAPSVSAGSPIGYVITVTNTGAGALTGVHVTDTLPTNPGLTWSIDAAGSSLGWSIAGGVLSFGPAPLLAGASVHVHITSPTTPASCGSVDNTAAVSSTNDGSASVGPVGITVLCATLGVTKTADAASVSAGDTIGYTVTISNTGLGDAAGVNLTDNLPGGNAATPVHWVIDNGIGQPAAFSLTGADGGQVLRLAGQPITLAAGQSRSVHLTAATTSTSCATYDNSAAVTSTNDGSPSAGPVTITVNCGALAITKTADAPSVSAGSPIGYVITVTNTGAGALTGVHVTDTLPTNPGLTWSIDAAGSSLGWSIAGGVLSFGPAPLLAGASVHVHITSPTTPASCGSVDNTAAVSSTNDGSASVGPVGITVLCATLGVTKTADAASVSAGDTIGYTVTISNTGLGDAAGVNLTDNLPGGNAATPVHWVIDNGIGQPAAFSLTGADGGQVLRLAGQPITLAAGQSRSVHLTAATTSTSCATYDNSAAVTSTNDGSPSAGPVTITVNCGALAITKTADAPSVSAGSPIGYVITVTNTGAGALTGVHVTDTLPTNPGLTWSIDAAGSSLGWSIAGGVLSFGPAPLLAGASVHVHITSPTTPASCGSVDNTAAVSSTNDGSASVGPVGITVLCATLGVTKTADAASVSAGDTIGYTVTISNTGLGDAAGVSLTDNLPGGNAATPVHWVIDNGIGQPAAFSLTGADGGQVLRLAGQPITLAAGQSRSVHLTAATTSTSCATYDNSAAVTSTNDGSPSVTDVPIAVNCPDLAITKVADAASVSAGDTIGYTVTLSNTGQGDATGVSLTDNLPGGNAATPVTWVIDNGVGQPAAFTLTGAPGSQVLTLAGQPITLGPGQSLVVHVTAVTTSTSCASYDNSASLASTNGTSPSVGPITITVNCGDLAITKTADAPSVSAGSPIGYVVTVTNNGAGTVVGLTVSDSLPTTPPGLTWSIDEANSDTGWTIAGGVLSYGPAPLLPTASVHVHVTSPTTSATCGTVMNSAAADSTNDGSPSVTDVPIAVNCPDLAITKVADAASVSAGDTIGYTVTLSNTGQGDATGVSLTDNLPGGNAATPVTWVIDNGVGQPAAFTLTGAPGSQVLTLAGQPITLGPGQSLVVHVTAVTTSTSCASYDNSASLASTNGTSPSVGPITITVNCGDLAITKTADAPSVSAGSPIGYVVTVTNNGAGTVVGLTVSDSLPTTPPGLTWSIDEANSDTGWTIAGGVLSYGPAPLLPTASVHVHVTSPTTSATCGTVMNSAAADSTNDGSPSVTDVPIAVNCPDLAITKVADAASVSAGDTIGYTVTLSNTGQGDATGVSLTDNLPGGNAATPVTWVIDNGVGQPAAFTLTGAPGSQVLTLAGQPITLGPGQSLVVHVTAVTTSTSCASYDNSASLASTNGTSPSVGPITITVNCGDLAITKTADAPSVSAGSPIGYVVTVTNNGAGTVVGLTVSDSLPTTPPGLTWSIDEANSDTGWTIAGGVLSYGPAPLLPTASVHVHVTSPTTSATCGTVMNSAAADSTNDGSPSVTDVPIAVNCPDLAITKVADAASVSAGDTIGYTVTLSNTGQGDATGVSLTDNLPGGNAATPVTWVIDNGVGQPAAFTLTGAPGSQVLTLAGQPITLGPGQSLVVHVTAVTTSTSCASYDNSASLASTNGTSPSVGPITITVNCGDLAITKTADAPSVSAGSPIGYVVTVTNNGAGTVTGLTVSDSLPTTPPGLTWSIDEANSDTGWTIAGGVLSYGPAPLLPTASVHVHVTSPTTSATCGTVMNSAAADSTNDGSPSVTDVPIAVNCPDLAITKVADAASVSAGDTIGYTVTLSNTGQGDATGVSLTDNLPGGNAATPVTWVIDNGVGQPAAFTLTGAPGSQVLTLAGQPITLGPGQSLVVHVTAVTTSTSCASYDNSASLASTNGTSPSVGPITITVNCGDLAITKTADAPSVSAGSPIGYVVTVTNNGAGTVVGLTVSDSLPTTPPGLTWSIDEANSDTGWTIAGGVLSYGPAPLLPTASVHVHVTSPTTSATCGTVMNSAAADSTNDGSPSVTDVPIAVNCPDLAITKVADAASVSAGDTIGYTVTLSNTGQGDATGVSLTDNLPGGNAATPVTWVIDNGVGQPAAFTLTGAPGSQVLTLAGQPITLGPGQSLVVHVTAVTTSTSCASYDNSASLASTNGTSPSVGPITITVNCGDLAITKTADAPSVSAGSPIGYVVTVTNNGAGTVVGLTVSDSLPTTPPGLTWSIDEANSDTGWTIAGGVLSYGPAPLLPTASVHVHVTSPTTSATCGTVMNSAAADSTNDGSPSVTDVPIAVNCPDLAITKVADAASVSAGDTIGYTVTLSNTGQGDATGVSLTDNLPGGNAATPVTWVIDNGVGQPAAFTLTGAPGSQVLTLAGQPITLGPGQSLVVHVTAVTTSTSCASYDNSASLASTNGTSPSVGPITITVNCGDLAITKTADAPSVSAGSPIGYVVTVTNNGAGTVVGLTVSDSLPTTPPGLTWSIDEANSDTGWTIAGGVLSYGPAPLLPTASVHVHVTSPTTSATCGTVMNSAAADSTNDGSPSVTDVPIAVNCPDLAITKVADAASVSAGDTIGYTVTLSNTGQGDATGVSLTDNLPGGNAATPVTWVIDNGVGQPAAFTLTGAPASQVLTLAGQPITLGPGQSRSVHVTAATTSTSCATYDNSASLTSTNGTSPSVGPITITVNCGDLAITKTADAPSVSAGSPIGYVVTVTNNGAGTVTGLTVSDSLPTTPPGLTWSIDEANSDTGWTIAGGVLSYGPAPLLPTASVHVHVTSPTTSATCGTVMNSAAADSINDGSPSVTDVPIAVNCPDLAITKVADAASVSAGDTIGYTVTLSNTGQGDATGVSLTDNLPGGNAATPVTWVIDNGVGQPAAFTLTGAPGSQVLTLAGQPITLGPGQSLVVHVTAVTTSTSCASYDNSASLASTNGTSPSVGPITITVNCGDLAITKTADAPSVSAGSPIGYVVTVTNNGAGTVTGLTVSDSLPGGNAATPVHWVIDPASGTPAAFSLGGADGSQVLSLAGQPITLGEGASRSVHVTAATSSTSCTTYDNRASLTSTNDGNPAVGPVGIVVNCPVEPPPTEAVSEAIRALGPSGSLMVGGVVLALLALGLLFVIPAGPRGRRSDDR